MSDQIQLALTPPSSRERTLRRVHSANGGSYSGCAVRTGARLVAEGHRVRRRLSAPLAVAAAMTAASLCCFGCGSSVTGSAASTVGSGGAGAARSRPARGISGFGSNWTTYHGNAEATGVDAAHTKLLPSRRAWTSPVLDGQLYGEPLVADGRVVAATENDTVYVMAAAAGASCGHATWRSPCHPVICLAATSRPRSALRAPR